MNKLCICGKGDWEISPKEIQQCGYEIWCCGTEKRDGADKYFELHGIKVNRENAVYELPEEVYKQGLPINNTISALLVYAWLQGYTCICVMGAPMLAQNEYITQRASVALIIGFLRGKGLTVSWTDEPKNEDYGKQSR